MTRGYFHNDVEHVQSTNIYLGPLGNQ